MVLFDNAQRIMLAWPSSTALMLGVLIGCAECDGNKPTDELMKRGNATVQTEINSPNCYLRVVDLGKFRPGRAKSDVLRDVQWRGNFDTAATYKGKSVCTVIYLLVPEGANSRDSGEWVLAVFLDGQFTKFVKPPSPQEDDFVVRYDPAYERNMPYLKPTKVSDCKFVIQAVDSAPVDITALEKHARDTPAAPSHSDPGLTGVFLALQPALSARWKREAKINVALRDQFNASRLRIGMTEREVESVLKAKALESANVEAGSYAIYGSNKSFDILSDLHFANILVVFRDGKVATIRSIPAGYEWRRKLSETSIDLPKRATAN